MGLASTPFSTPFRSGTTTPFGDVYHQTDVPPARVREAFAQALRSIEIEFTRPVNLASLTGFTLTDSDSVNYPLSAPVATADPKVWMLTAGADMPVMPVTLTLNYDGSGPIVDDNGEPVSASSVAIMIYEAYAPVGAAADEYYAPVGAANQEVYVARAA